MAIILSLSQHDDVTQSGIEAINTLLDGFMGINDSELATQVIHIIRSLIDTSLILLLQSHLSDLGFSCEQNKFNGFR